jgi:excisionase family DNA binding protein
MDSTACGVAPTDAAGTVPPGPWTMVYTVLSSMPSDSRGSAMYRRRRAEGLCVRCGAETPVKTYRSGLVAHPKRCESCQHKENLASRRRRRKAARTTQHGAAATHREVATFSSRAIDPPDAPTGRSRLSPQGPPPDVMTVGQTAAYLQVAARTLYRLMAHEGLPYTKLMEGRSGSVRFVRREIEQWLQARTRR